MDLIYSNSICICHIGDSVSSLIKYHGNHLLLDRGEISITGTELIVGEVKAQSMLAGQLTACEVNSVVNPLTAKNECHGFMTVTGPLQLP